MTKKGSALMQVMVVGLIVAAFSVLMLRYAVTRSANLSRTERILESKVVADSCLDQYMAYLAEAELFGRPTSDAITFNCLYYSSMTAADPSTIEISVQPGTNEANKDVSVLKFTVPAF